MDTHAWIDQMDAQLTDVIRRHGWFIEYVGGACEAPGCPCGEEEDEPPFAYTIGLFGLRHPELLIFGVEPATAGLVLNALGERIRRGGAVLPGIATTVDGWPHEIIPEPVPNAGDIVLGANTYYDRPPPLSVSVLQLTYADERGRYPWDPGCTVADVQPRPGTFTA